MQIVIDTMQCPCRTLNDECDISGGECYEDDICSPCPLIRNGGIKLPKGHGRLGDLDALEKEIVNGIKAGNYEEGYDTFAHINDMDDCVECVRYTPTIIEADKKERPDNICTQRCCLKNHNIGIIECDEECSNRTSF